MIGIGIDTGGTFTDAVIFDDESNSVLAECKTLTTHEDLTRCIGAALDKLPPDLLAQAQRVSLSTTLATNACVEGKGGRAKLVIAGTTESVLHRIDAQGKYGIPYTDVLPIDFKGSYDGTQAQVPDWAAICNEHADFFADADSFGIAGLFALNNGAIVERTGAEYLQEHYGKPVVKATTVATALNVIERGATAMLNARLIPVIDEFIAAMRVALKERGLDVPIGIVRSNGTLMSSDFAQFSPVETILSGPAASTVGALGLAHVEEGLVIDIGGTTSDICVVHGGRPCTSEGIRIGPWRTQVKGAKIDTIGLGGDSVVRQNKTGKLEVQARRVLPLCIAATRWPEIKEYLRAYCEKTHYGFKPLFEFVYLAKEPSDPRHYTDTELRIIDQLREGPIQLADSRLELVLDKLGRLEDEGVLMRCGVTTTDAMHVIGDFTAYDVEASRLGMRCILCTIPYDEDMTPEEREDWLAEKIYRLAQRKLYHQIVRVLIADRYPALEDQPLSEQLEVLADDAWQRYVDGTPAAPFDVDFITSMTLVGIGAPTHVLLPDVARALRAPFIVPEHAGVANAVGAICARVIAEAVVRVVPHRVAGGVVDSYMVSGSAGSFRIINMGEAVEFAKKKAAEAAREEALMRGASGEITCSIVVDETSMGDNLVPLDWTVHAYAELV